MTSEVAAYTLRRTFSLLGRLIKARSDIKELITSGQIKTFIRTQSSSIFIPSAFWQVQGPKCFNFVTDYDDSCAEIYLPHLFDYLLPDLRLLKNSTDGADAGPVIQLSTIDFKFRKSGTEENTGISRSLDLAHLLLDIIENSQNNLVVYCLAEDVDRLVEVYRSDSGEKRGRKRKHLDQEFWIKMMEVIYRDKGFLKQDAVKQEMNDWCIKEDLDPETYSKTFVDDRVEDAWRSLKLARNTGTKKAI